MSQTKQNNIRLVVDDEEALYNSFSVDDEFNESVKSYIRSKLINIDYRDSINMTVMAREPINEDRFRSAVSIWVKNERESMRKRERETKVTLFGTLLFGSVLIILSLLLEQQFSVLKYSLLPIMGSISLGQAARLLVMGLPTLRVEKWLLNESAKNSVITFEYADEEKPRLTKNRSEWK